MTGDDVTKLALGVLALATAAVQVLRSRHTRRSIIKQDLDILALLPEASDARGVLQQHIETSISRLVYDEEIKRRDRDGMLVGVLITGLGLVVCGVGVGSHGYWLLLLIPGILVAFVGVVGFGHSYALRERDEKGNVLPPDHSVATDGRNGPGTAERSPG